MEELKRQIKECIVRSLELEDVRPEDIADDEPIFGAGLGLDSIDSLELGVALKKQFGVRFESSDPNVRRHFASVSALAEFIAGQRGSEA